MKENNIVSVNISSTHTHSSIDTMGIWGRIIEVFKNLDFDRLLYFLDDDIFYENIKSILFDKQFLYLIDCFKNINGFYNVKSLVNLINNFDVLTDFDDELMMFEIVEKNIRLPLTFTLRVGLTRIHLLSIEYSKN